MNDGTPVSLPQNASPQWIASRIGTLLDHYYQPGQTPEATEAAMVDWIRLLSGLPKSSISAACDGYLRDQPRRRPTPGDIANRAKSITEHYRRAELADSGVRNEEAAVVDWAVQSGRLMRPDAMDAVIAARGKTDWPEWVPECTTSRAMYCVRKHPNFQDRKEAGFAPRKF